MWRSLFLALGIMLVVLGAECLLIESATLYAAGEKPSGSYLMGAPPAESGTRQFKPTEWLPWSLMGAGMLTILYAITLRRSAPAEE